MILSFRHRGIKRLLLEDSGELLRPSYIRRIEYLLDALNSAKTIQDMNLPGTRLHQLRGDRKETWSVHVSKNWRLTFRFENGHAYDVNLEDYH